MKKKQSSKLNGSVIFVKSFRHWKTGKIIKAEDYGKIAFAIPIYPVRKAS